MYFQNDNNVDFYVNVERVLKNVMMVRVNLIKPLCSQGSPMVRGTVPGATHCHMNPDTKLFGVFFF